MTRGALPDVLAAAVDLPPAATALSAAAWWECAAGVRLSAEGVAPPGSCDVWPWRDDAFESLLSRGLVPEHWSDPERAPKWSAHLGCGGAYHDDVPRRWCAECDGSGDVAVDDMPTLVSVASSGAAALARVEAVVAEGWPGSRVVWRALTHKQIRNHHNYTSAWTAEMSTGPHALFSREWCYAEATLPGLERVPWPKSPPTKLAKPRRAWRFVRGVAVEDVDDGAPRRTDFHLLRCGRSVVVLGVELVSCG